MSRRLRVGPLQATTLRMGRMAPGGRVKSESPVPKTSGSPVTQTIPGGGGTEPTPIGHIRYSPWITDTLITGQLAVPKVYVGQDPADNPEFRALGDGTTIERSYTVDVAYGDTGATNSLQYASSEASYVPPGFYAFDGNQWVVAGAVHHPVRDGIPIVIDPSGIGYPTFLGWDLGSVQYFDFLACSSYPAYPEAQALYDEWVAAGGDQDYEIFITVNVAGPVLAGSGYMDAWYRRVFRSAADTGHALSNTVTIGTATSLIIQDNAAGTLPTTFKDRVFMTDAFTPISGGTAITATEPVFATSPYTGQSFSGLPLPAVTSLPGWGPCRVPAYRHVTVPSSVFPEPADEIVSWVVQACLDFKCYGQATLPPYRIIYLDI